MGTCVENFGRNVRFTPSLSCRPQTESEVLQILDEHRNETIRVGGSLHSWSEAAATDGVFLDLSNFNSVNIDRVDDQIIATVGAGCRIKRLLIELERLGNVTVPSVGLIDEQTMAGAISTGTHGSGKHSLSHYISEVRIATYDDQRRAVIRTINDGPELQAARCSLGLLGVILSVCLCCRTNYNVEEHMRHHSTLDEVLSAESKYPLQQFFLVPWAWSLFAQHRRETELPRSRDAWLYQLHWYWMVDVVLHIQFCTLARWLRFRWLSKFFFRKVLPAITIVGWKVIDQSQTMLVMEHELFRHIEIEIFVESKQLACTLEFVRKLLETCSLGTVPDALRQQATLLELSEGLDDIAGCYTHKYPICVRKILPDDTLISMASGMEPVYSLSFISYERPNDRAGFSRFARFLAESTAQLFRARPHWGKVNPLSPDMLRQQYPRWNQFESVCRVFDPSSNFTNRWLSEIRQEAEVP